jgi:hypothetical protein
VALAILAGARDRPTASPRRRLTGLGDLGSGRRLPLFGGIMPAVGSSPSDDQGDHQRHEPDDDHEDEQFRHGAVRTHRADK